MACLEFYTMSGEYLPAYARDHDYYGSGYYACCAGLGQDEHPPHYDGSEIRKWLRGWLGAANDMNLEGVLA